MNGDRSIGMRALVVAARLAILASVVVGIIGLSQVVGRGIETGEWEPALAVGWMMLGALPYVAGTLTGQALRGPGDEGLKAVCVVTTSFGVLAVALWILDGISRR